MVTVSDLAAHLPLPLGAAAAGDAAGGSGGGWEPWSGHDPVAVLEGPEAAMQRRTALLGLLAEVHHHTRAGVGRPRPSLVLIADLADFTSRIGNSSRRSAQSGDST